MRKNVNLKELSEPIQSFLTQVKDGDAVLVSDETGQIQYSVVRLTRASKAERKQAWRSLGKIQDKVGKMMKKTGKTEEEFDQLLQQDD